MVNFINNIKNRECKYCHQKFNMKGLQFSNHVKYCKLKLNNQEREIYCQTLSKAIKSSYDKKFGKIKSFFVNCSRCNSLIEIKEREKQFPKKEKYYCNRTCANTRKHTEKTKQRIKNSICKNGLTLSENTTLLWKNPEYSKSILNHNICFSSKGERELRDWFIKTFPNEEWTYGGHLVYNNLGISRDLYSKKLKICIEYDGEWHFKNLVNNQLKSKQDKDQALECWCIDNEWKLIRIKDEIYQSNPSLWKEKIRNEILTGKNKIVKFY